MIEVEASPDLPAEPTDPVVESPVPGVAVEGQEPVDEASAAAPVVAASQPSAEVMELRATLAEMRAEFAEFKAAKAAPAPVEPAAPVETPDPEPDAKSDPVGFLRWNQRQEIKGAVAPLMKEVAELRAQLAATRPMVEERAETARAREALAKVVADVPEFKDRAWGSKAMAAIDADPALSAVYRHDPETAFRIAADRQKASDRLAAAEAKIAKYQGTATARTAVAPPKGVSPGVARGSGVATNSKEAFSSAVAELQARGELPANFLN